MTPPWRGNQRRRQRPMNQRGTPSWIPIRQSCLPDRDSSRARHVRMRAACLCIPADVGAPTSASLRAAVGESTYSGVACSLRVMANRRSAVLYAAFALSGVAALLYEITWTRLLTLFLGHTVAAVSTVLAAFMGGLAAGAALAGRVAPALSPAAALRAYAGVEVFVAVCSLAVPFALAALEPMLARRVRRRARRPVVRRRATRLCARRGDRPGGRDGCDPAARRARWRRRRSRNRRQCWPAVRGEHVRRGRRRRTGGLRPPASARHAADDWRRGGAESRRGCGRVVAGESTVTSIPESRSQPALAPGTVRGRPVDARSPAPTRLAAVASARRARPSLRRLALVAVGVSGAAAIVQQIAWTRIVALAMGPTTFALSAVVAIFIGGLALGAFAGAWVAGRTTSVAPLVAALCGAGLLALMVLGGVPWAVIRVAEAVAAPGVTFGTLVRSHAILLAVSLLPLTLALGAVFPLVLGVATIRQARQSRSARRSRPCTSRTPRARSPARSPAAFGWCPRSGWKARSAPARSRCWPRAAWWRSVPSADGGRPRP